MCLKQFFENCENAEIKCYKCLALHPTISNKLYYNPLHKKQDSKLTFQNYQKILNQDIELNNKKINYCKKGNKIEKQILKKLSATPTLKSGAIFGDGDGYLTIKQRKYYLEHKTRFNNRNLLSLTKSEYEKAIAQKIELFLVTNNNTQETIISMNLNTFLEIVNN